MVSQCWPAIYQVCRLLLSALAGLFGARRARRTCTYWLAIFRSSFPVTSCDHWLANEAAAFKWLDLTKRSLSVPEFNVSPCVMAVE